nr:MAG TPA: hypothetical protein [Caudoviricetes sp.]
MSSQLRRHKSRGIPTPQGFILAKDIRPTKVYT